MAWVYQMRVKVNGVDTKQVSLSTTPGSWIPPAQVAIFSQLMAEILVCATFKLHIMVSNG